MLDLKFDVNQLKLISMNKMHRSVVSISYRMLVAIQDFGLESVSHRLIGHEFYTIRMTIHRTTEMCESSHITDYS